MVTIRTEGGRTIQQRSEWICDRSWSRRDPNPISCHMSPSFRSEEWICDRSWSRRDPNPNPIPCHMSPSFRMDLRTNQSSITGYNSLRTEGVNEYVCALCGGVESLLLDNQLFLSLQGDMYNIWVNKYVTGHEVVLTLTLTLTLSELKSTSMYVCMMFTHTQSVWWWLVNFLHKLCLIHTKKNCMQLKSFIQEYPPLLLLLAERRNCTCAKGMWRDWFWLCLTSPYMK